MLAMYWDQWYIFHVLSMWSTTPNMSSFKSQMHPMTVRLVDTILATILGVVAWTFPIINPFDFFPVSVPISLSTNPSLIPIGTGSPLLESPVSLYMVSADISSGFSK